MEVLQKLADQHAERRDVAAYMAVRADMEKLTDEDSPSKELTGLVAPDTGDLILNHWTDKRGEIIPEAPNDMLLSNLYQSSYLQIEESDQIKKMLAERGYTDEDLFLAKHFRFKKDDAPNEHREIAHVEILRAFGDIEQEIEVEPIEEEKENFINQNFYFARYTTELTKPQTQRFIDEYRQFLTDSKNEHH